MDVSDGSLRRNAFAKLANLTTRNSQLKNHDGFERLVKALPPIRPQTSGYLDGVLRAIAPSSRLRMSARELDVLLALCSTASKLVQHEHAEKLASQLGAYLPEAHTQLFIPSPFLQEIKPSPWAVLTEQLTSALLTLGLKFPSLRNLIKERVNAYISNWISAATALSKGVTEEGDLENSEVDAVEVAAVAVSMVGFMDAAARHENLWTPWERLDVIRSIRDALSEQFLIALETATSIIRHSSMSDATSRDWKKSLKHYAANGAPLGAMLLQRGFMRLVLACTSRLLCSDETLETANLLEQYSAGVGPDRQSSPPVEDEMLEYLVELVTEQMIVLEDGSDYLQLSSSWQQRLAFSVKANALEAFAHCMIIDEDIADAEVLLRWVEESIDSQPQMANPELATVVMRSLTMVARYIPEGTSNFAKLLLRFIVQGTSQSTAIEVASTSLAHILRIISQDAIITTLYSLGNVLSSQTGAEKPHQTGLPLPDMNGHHNSVSSAGRLRAASVISLSWSGDEETSFVCGNVARAIVRVAITCNDPKITTLAQTMMIQKIGRINILVDAHIIEEAARLAVYGKENELRVLLRLFSRLHQDATQQKGNIVYDAVQRARQYLASHIGNKSSLFRVLAVHLLERVLSKGDVVEGEFKHTAEFEEAAQEIAPLLKPLSILASRQPHNFTEFVTDEVAEVEGLAREAWFNIAVHGITLQSRLGQQHYEALRLLAMHSLPLVDAERAELLESDVELNTILRRGMSSQHAAEQKKSLSAIIPERDHEIRHLSYQKVVFLNTVYLVESLRAASGSCAEILEYFADPTLQTSDMGKCMSSIADAIIKSYINKAQLAKDDDYSAPYISRQLAKVLSACCHRSAKMQDVARAAASHIIASAPSALCQKSSMFALLELLTLMWSSCLEAEIDEYGWKSTFVSARGKVKVELSDDYAFRRRTLDLLYSEARRWMTSVIALAPLDIKGLLQTYLSEFDDTGSYGHISLGRSFALEMGSLIPPTDPRLGAIGRERQSANVNVASDFIAQYTTRQEYRFAGAPQEDSLAINYSASHDDLVTSGPRSSLVDNATDEAQTTLADLESRAQHHQRVSITEFKSVLRRAAALLCRSKGPQSAIARHLVQIPFEVFNKDSIKMGISLWLGVIHENPRMEPRILTEVAQAWEKTIDRKIGIFNPQFKHLDPFYVKMEFAPSDRGSLHRQSQVAQSAISPHLRVLQFFESHFNAIRLGSLNTQRTMVRMIDKTLEGFMHLNGHPLLREIHFHVVLFALWVLQNSTCLTKTTRWKLKDRIASLGLRWFTHPPYWSFGGNRIQVKAEVKVMNDVLNMLSVSRTANSGPAINQKQNLQQKQDLLEILIRSEITRLQVFLQPVSPPGALASVVNDVQIASFARCAWTEDPALAIQLVTRFPSSQLHKDVRFLLCNFPNKALHEANAVDLLLGDSLPTDLAFQLKYLIVWNYVNPMQAVTYFMPAFGNHPFILQYAMRALESHSVDITFFYVPQIVQCLRYDALGYVERYIVDTGKISQLFAHQIIWNMKANAYKDDDSTIPDPAKPILDKVMNSLIASFSGEDKDFYEREFAFFGEVTDISGKLKPYIKKSKPEKKAKIEEELRKIKVEVGVYLPSNPDGVVVGIDRKSGKPLQSHAKAPYMATFRIRKTKDATNEEVDKMVEEAPKHQTRRPKGHKKNSSSELSTVGALADANTYEVWQSAIFKVGDDCRQDVLALQMIAAFRGIFNSVGLDVYVFPYRVTATAPGCGVIDVLPNSISRDMLGREAVNGLYDYFVTKYGGEHSVRFQEARSEFVKSMAAYSVVSYLLQFKDRHNGNIMIDDKGHILHIDFGFCFDIAPGGVKFERAPFKLTPEMLAVMGANDSNTSQAFRWFEELTIKAFLTSRQYCDKLCHLVTLMLDSGLPCFKPETIANFRDRFVLDKSEKEAADYMQHCIKKSAANFSTKVYDEFQLITNGIPY